MKQLFTKKELIGKTISNVYMMDGIFCSDLWIKFTDDSFVVFLTKNNNDGFGYDEHQIEIDDCQKDSTDSELVELGFITKNENQLAIKKQEELYELEREQYNLKRKLSIEEEEKKLLQELKNKYENK